MAITVAFSVDIAEVNADEDVVVLVGNNCNNLCKMTLQNSVVILFCVVTVKL